MVFCYPALANQYTYLLVYNCLYLEWAGDDHLAFYLLHLYTIGTQTAQQTYLTICYVTPLFSWSVCRLEKNCQTRDRIREEFTGVGVWLLAQRASLLTDHGEPPVRTVGWFKGEQTPSRVTRRPGFDPWVGKTPLGKGTVPTPVILPGEVHAGRSPAGYSPWGGRESDTTEQLTLSLFTFIASRPKKNPAGRVALGAWLGC